MKDNTNIYRQAPAAGGNPSKLVIFLHGYGADGKTLLTLQTHFLWHCPMLLLFLQTLLSHVQCLHREDNGFHRRNSNGSDPSLK
jgi:predicted esterase